MVNEGIIEGPPCPCCGRYLPLSMANFRRIVRAVQLRHLGDTSSDGRSGVFALDITKLPHDIDLTADVPPGVITRIVTEAVLAPGAGGGPK